MQEMLQQTLRLNFRHGDMCPTPQKALLACKNIYNYDTINGKKEDAITELGTISGAVMHTGSISSFICWFLCSSWDKEA